MKTKMMFASIVIGFASLVILFMIGPRPAWGQDGNSDVLDPRIQVQIDEAQAQANQIQAQANQIRTQANRIQSQATQTRIQNRFQKASNDLFGLGGESEFEARKGMEYGDFGRNYGGEFGGRGFVFWNRRSQGKTDAEMHKAMKKLQTTTSEKDKVEAVAALSALLNRHFTADMKKREQNIASIEARVQKLRTQFEKRQVAKDKIIKLQLQVLSNEAEGLGFFSPSNGASNPPPPSQQPNDSFDQPTIPPESRRSPYSSPPVR